MECAGTASISDTEYLIQFSREAHGMRIPLSGSLDLTHRCNLQCVHCYVGPHPLGKSTIKKEMSTDRILAVIDEFTEAGCLFMLISGGEPLLRKDFKKIYCHIKLNGLLVTVFTNGTLINEDILELFDHLPPQAVEISIYGATSDTYERITGVSGSFRRCMQGIQNLLDHNINVKLKTILMTLNMHEFSAMEHIAKEFGVKFRFDAAIFPRFNGDRSPLNLRVAPEYAVEKELSGDEKLGRYREHFQRHRGLPVLDTLYVCSAGITNFHIDPYGNLQPCLMTRDIQWNLSEQSFSEGWTRVIPNIMERKVKYGYACHLCEQQSLCGFCPAFFQLETGSEYIRSEYLCSMGRHRNNMICYTL